MLANIKKLRLEKGVSQQKLADEIGMSQQSINKYENHDIEPDITTLKRIADYFETSIDYIVGHTDIRQKIQITNDFSLNNDEAGLIVNYRALPPKSRVVIESLVEEMVDLKKCGKR